ncbi:lazarillo protein [Culicoides brevitarsis]|uniref:lazarillo protein n=1 Tax=Culicoides brevitarsis TaxID=469753 RepID=UPI00307BE2E1
MKSWMILFALLYAVNGQTQVPGVCPSHVVQSNFNLTAYVGKWYENKRYANSFQNSGDCVTAQYTINPDNATVRVVNEMVILPDTKNVLSINGTAKLQSTTPPIDGRLLVNFFGNWSDYWVLNTDYNNYAVVWSCSNVGNNSMQSAWILTRERRPSADILNKVNSLMPVFRLNETLFRQTEQSKKICMKNGAPVMKIVSPIVLSLMVGLFWYSTRR